MDSEPGFVIEKLDRSHDHSRFDCGEQGLNDYLRRFARQNQEKRLGTTYVATRKAEIRVVAYYTISSGQVAPAILQEQDRRSLPRYPVPVVRIGRLAVDNEMQRKGLGGIMLVDALRRACTVSETLGIHAVEVDALTDAARCFYNRFGFKSLTDDQLHLYLPISTVRKAFG